MNNIDEILERLKGAQPEIDNPDEFTSRIVKFVRIVLTAAAVLLVGLFIYTNDLDADTPSTTQTNYQISGFTYGDYLKNVYTNRQNQASINYLQLKKLHYENH